MFMRFFVRRAKEEGGKSKTGVPFDPAAADTGGFSNQTKDSMKRKERENNGEKKFIYPEPVGLYGRADDCSHGPGRGLRGLI